MKPINRFLLENSIRIAENPCVSPDFCLDWEGLKGRIRSGVGVVLYRKSVFETAAGCWQLLEDEAGDYAWRLEARKDANARSGLTDGFEHDGMTFFPATFENLIALKNEVLESDSKSTIFPSAAGDLGRSTLGIGARFTTLHWPGVDWAMSNLGLGMTANQNSIPRELVYDVDVMLSDELDTVPFPFIGTHVPEGHQGQSVEGMSHGCVLAKLKTGFHQRGIAWSFNADHQPIGGKFDAREDKLVAGCLFATYITFDLSPELAVTQTPETAEERRAFVEAEIDAGSVVAVAKRVKTAGLTLDQTALDSLLCYVWPALKKMKIRDQKYRDARNKAFTTDVGRAFLRELSIDELPGLTAPETTAIMLALCFELDMSIHFVAPAFGFQKNMPFPDNDRLRKLVQDQWKVCQAFGVSIGFHSGSGKSAENYQVMGEVTGGNLEIKTSGRYTYEMGVALHRSTDPADQALWSDWYAFTRDLAVEGAFSSEATEQKMAREFIVATLEYEKAATDIFGTKADCRSALERLTPHPDHMFWFEYNFLFVLAADGRAEKSALGDHSPEGYRQRARFYTISDQGRLEFARGVARYIVFLARHTGLANTDHCDQVERRLMSYQSFDAFLDDIADSSVAAV